MNKRLVCMCLAWWVVCVYSTWPIQPCSSYICGALNSCLFLFYYNSSFLRSWRFVTDILWWTFESSVVSVWSFFDYYNCYYLHKNSDTAWISICLPNNRNWQRVAWPHMRSVDHVWRQCLQSSLEIEVTFLPPPPLSLLPPPLPRGPGPSSFLFPFPPLLPPPPR